MTGRLYLLISEAVPDLEDDAEREDIFVCGDDDAQDPSPEETFLPEADCACMTTLVTNCPDDEQFRSDVAEWWQSIAGVTPLLELLTAEQSLMSDDQRASIAALRGESWSIRTPLVIYRRGSREGEAESRRLVTESALTMN